MNKHGLAEYAEYLLQAAMHKCDDLADAQDLAQETLLTAMTAIQNGKQINNPKSWLLTVLDHKYYDMLRSKYRKPAVCIDVIGEIEDADTSEVDCESAENIRRCLANLTKIYREVMVQRYMYGMSLAEISERLGIPESTVKNRLFIGRKNIRKEFESNMENYTKQSYEPDELWVCISGQEGLGGEPFSVVGNDRIAMNLLILSYEKPVTLPELAQAIGISTTFIEPIVERLVKNELMKTQGGRVYTDFIIYTEADRTANLNIKIELAKKLCGGIWEIINEGLGELSEREYYKLQPYECAVKLQSFFVVRTLQNAVNAVRDEVCGGRLDFEKYPDRPNGGKWFAMGNAYPHGYDHSASPYLPYAISGEASNIIQDFLGTKQIALCDYDTEVLGKSYQQIDQAQKLKFFYMLHIGKYDLLDMIDRSLLDKTEEFIAHDLLARDEDKKLRLNIPVISMQDRWDIYSLSDKYNNIIAEKFHDEFLKLMKTPVKLPKHLKSVPKWQQYMRCADSFPMAVVCEARERGTFLKGYGKPAPAIMLCVEK